MSLRHIGSYNNICNPGFKYELDSLWPHLENKQVCETRNTLGKKNSCLDETLQITFQLFFVQLLLV